MSDPFPRLARSRSRGLIAGVAIVVVAGAIYFAWPRDVKDHADTAALADDLRFIRKAIATYRQKHGRGPAKLTDLVQDHELRAIPIDPITHAADWQVTTEETVGSNEFTDKATSSSSAIIDVHSSAAGYASY